MGKYGEIWGNQGVSPAVWSGPGRALCLLQFACNAGNFWYVKRYGNLQTAPPKVGMAIL